MTVNDGFNFGDLSVDHFQTHGEEIGIRHVMVFYDGEISRDPASLRIINIVAVFTVRIERHPQRLAEGNLRAIFGVAVMRRHWDKRRIVFRERVQIGIHEALETAFIASAGALRWICRRTVRERDESHAEDQDSSEVADKGLQTKSLYSDCAHCFLASLESCRFLFSLA